MSYWLCCLFSSGPFQLCRSLDGYIPTVVASLLLDLCQTIRYLASPFLWCLSSVCLRITSMINITGYLFNIHCSLPSSTWILPRDLLSKEVHVLKEKLTLRSYIQLVLIEPRVFVVIIQAICKYSSSPRHIVRLHFLVRCGHVTCFSQ